MHLRFERVVSARYSSFDGTAHTYILYKQDLAANPSRTSERNTAAVDISEALEIVNHSRKWVAH